MNVTRRGLVGAGAAALLAVAAFAPIGSPGLACVTVLERVAEVRAFYDAADEVTLTSAERTDMNRDLALATKAENQCLASGTTTTTVPTTSTTVPTTTTTGPQQTGYPNASNTGVPAGTSLTNSGSISSSSNGQVIDRRNVTGQITVKHDNVTIRRTRVVGSGIYIDPSTSGTVIEDCELDGSPMTNADAAVGVARFTIRRCNIHHFGEGISANGETVIEDNFIHSFQNFIDQGAHQDGIQMEWGSNQMIRHNTILVGVPGANAGVWVSGEEHSNVVIENNVVGTGGNFAIGAGDQAVVRNNRISTIFEPQGGYWGPFTYIGGSAVVTGNVWHDGPNAGQPAT